MRLDEVCGSGGGLPFGVKTSLLPQEPRRSFQARLPQAPRNWFHARFTCSSSSRSCNGSVYTVSASIKSACIEIHVITHEGLINFDQDLNGNMCNDQQATSGHVSNLSGLINVDQDLNRTVLS